MGKRCLVLFLLASTLALTASAAAQETAAGAADETTGLDLETLRAQIARVAAPALESPVPAAAVHALTVNGAVDVALVNNLDLQIAERQRNATSHEVPAARAKFHPTPGAAYAVGQTTSLDPAIRDAMGNVDNVDANSTITTQGATAFVRQEAPTGASLRLATDLFVEDIGGEDLDDGRLAVELRQPLMRGGRVYVARREILDAEYDPDFEQASLQAEVLRITRDTKVAYYNSILAARLIDVTRAAVARDEALIEASEALFAAARSSKRDVVSAQIRLADDQALLSERLADHHQALLELRDVLGLPLGERVVPAESVVPFRPVAFQTESWVARALDARPEIRAVGALLEQAALSARVAGNDVLPALDLLGLYERGDSGPGLSRAFRLASQRWSTGFEFEIPFGNVAARERLKAAEIVESRLERELVRQQRAIEREVRSEAIELLRNLEAIRLQADKVEHTREKLSVALARYRLGIANNLDIVDAQEDLLDAETDLTTALFDYTTGLARLEAATAGPVQ